MMMMVPSGGESAFDSWKHCGVGSYVVSETRGERQMPRIDELRKGSDVPEGFDIDQWLQSMGVDPKTGMHRHVMTTRTRLVEIAEDSLVIEFEISSDVAGFVSQKHRVTVPAQEPPEEEIRTIVEDTPDCHAEVVRTPSSAMTPVRPPEFSQESLTVAGRTLLCQVTESLMRTPVGEMRFKVWTSPEVPGLVVRHEVKADDHRETTVVTSFEKK
jgi:hypothetical protein